jgi:putative SOS response-associated peptidase YedK
MKLRRCLVPADFIYEWQKADVKTKQPYAIGMKDGSLFAFAGLWERWTDKTTGATRW